MTNTDSFAVWRDVRALVMDGLDGYRKQVAELTGLPFSRVRALRRLRTGPLTHAALAEAMMVDRPAATVAVDDLCARGLVIRASHPTDRRCKLVSLTPDGQRMTDKIESVVPPPPPGWDDLSPSELDLLARLVRQLRGDAPTGHGSGCEHEAAR
jgi:DNA-binding MarR family transcriptional regulator